MGRDVYTYLHLPVVAGIVLSAVGDELLIRHPGDPLGLPGALVTLGGPALYLLGLMACAWRVGLPVWLGIALIGLDVTVLGALAILMEERARPA